MRVAVLALVLVGGGVAHAEEAGGAEPKLLPPPTKPIDRPMGLSHKGQLQISVRVALGLRAIAVYNNDEEYCGEIDTADNSFAPVCTGRAPFALDFELGYGIARKVDAFLELRIGLESDFGSSPTDTEGARPFHLSPGARFFFSDAGKTKLFTTAQLVIDASGYKDIAGSKLGTDLGLRNMSGLWVDLDKAYGFYAFIGETATFARWLRFELEAGVGFQGRYR